MACRVRRSAELSVWEEMSPSYKEMRFRTEGYMANRIIRSRGPLSP